MKKALFLFVPVMLMIAACDSNKDDQHQILSRGLSVSSSDGKYIGEIIGIADTLGRKSTCVWVYRPEIDSIFGINLEDGTPCNVITIKFANSGCDYSGDLCSTYAPGTKWVTFSADTGEIYAPTSSVEGTMTLRSELVLGAQGRACEDFDTPREENFGSDSWYRLTPTGETIDVGTPPIMIEVRE